MSHKRNSKSDYLAIFEHIPVEVFMLTVRNELLSMITVIHSSAQFFDEVLEDSEMRQINAEVLNRTKRMFDILDAATEHYKSILSDRNTE